MDIFEKFQNKLGPLGYWSEKAPGYIAFPKLEGEISNRMRFRGKEKIVWSLNNYLGLANHPEVRRADTDAVEKFGLASPMGARMMSGNSDLHELLERELADFTGKEDAILFNYGYQGMVSAIDTLCGRHDVVVYDAESHACIVDGLRLIPSHRYVYKHNDIADCDKQLARAAEMVKKTGGGILVITEGVFGMSGDQGKIREIAVLKEKYDFRLFVDDAHGFGTMGKTGAGIGEEQHCAEDIDVYFSTFAKSMASIGGFLAGDKTILTFLRNNMRSQIYAKTLPIVFVAGNLKRLELLRNKPELREKLWHNVRRLQDGFRQRGFDLGTTNTPVTPVFIKGSMYDAIHLLSDMRERLNIFCSAVIYPVIPRGQVMFRLIPTAVHTDEDIDETLAAFSSVYEKLEKKQYPQGLPSFLEDRVQS